MSALQQSLAFLVELAALAAFGRWGWMRFDSLVPRFLAAALCVAVIAILWARFAAPSAPGRLRMPALLLFKIAIFASAAGALLSTGDRSLAAALAVVAAVQLALAVALEAV
ncbi:YrdB family protein [Acidimangrovimonas pyrenivorans]|uniref:YrdB family protein n=1 Tax=Acidimangrovimonas pyrenivorans TaxID=2030798 RepID=A0ABV7AJC3_9RHOB